MLRYKYRQIKELVTICCGEILTCMVKIVTAFRNN